MNFEKPVEFDVSKAVRFDTLAVGELFVTVKVVRIKATNLEVADDEAL